MTCDCIHCSHHCLPKRSCCSVKKRHVGHPHSLTAGTCLKSKITGRYEIKQVRIEMRREKGILEGKEDGGKGKRVLTTGEKHTRRRLQRFCCCATSTPSHGQRGCTCPGRIFAVSAEYMGDVINVLKRLRRKREKINDRLQAVPLP